jgi:signal transduction histidine kinase
VKRPRRDVSFSSEKPRAVRTFWRILQAAHPEVWDATFSVLKRDPEHRLVLSTLPPGALREQGREAAEGLAVAARGDWTRLHAFLRSQARLYAERGLSFAAWNKVARAFRDSLRPHVVKACARSTPLLQAVLQVVNEFNDYLLAFMGTEYVAAKHDALRMSEAKMRALAHRLQTVLEEERMRIARDLHDQLGEHLTLLRLEIERCQRLVVGNVPGEDVAARLQAALGLMDSTMTTVRRLAGELRPGVLDELGLVEALQWQAQEFGARSGVDVIVQEDDGDTPVTREQATALFRCFQEILTNVARHARARRVVARIHRFDGRIQLDVQDDGRGITAAEVEAPGSLGLVGMRERAALLGGTFSIQGSGGGTTVSITLPVGRSR